MLKFTKDEGGGFSCIGNAGKYKIQQGFQDTWGVFIIGRKLPLKLGLAKFANAVNFANEYEDEYNLNHGLGTDGEKPTNTMKEDTKMIVKKNTAKVSAPVTPIVKRGRPAGSVNKVKETAAPVRTATVQQAKAVVSAKSRKPAAFPSYDEWLEENPIPARVTKGTKREEESAYNRRVVLPSKMTYGREKKKYNTANGITEETVVSTPVTRTRQTADKVAEVAPEPARRGRPAGSKNAGSSVAVTKKETEAIVRGRGGITAEEKNGETWHEFGPKPDNAEFCYARLMSARASRDYAMSFARLHPYGDVAQSSYYGAVEKCYNLESEFAQLLADGTSFKPAKNFANEYYGLMVGEVAEDEQEALSHYLNYWNSREPRIFGKQKMELSGDTLPLIAMFAKRRTTSKR